MIQNIKWAKMGHLCFNKNEKKSNFSSLTKLVKPVVRYNKCIFLCVCIYFSDVINLKWSKFITDSLVHPKPLLKLMNHVEMCSLVISGCSQMCSSLFVLCFRPCVNGSNWTELFISTSCCDGPLKPALISVPLSCSFSRCVCMCVRRVCV